VGDDTPPPDLDDPPDPGDWFAPKTEADAPRLPVPVTTRDPVTAPHPITGDVAQAFENGRRQGFTDGVRAGQADAMDALISIIEQHFGKDPVLRHVVAAVRQRLTPV
jgi:hypothetical protein